MLFFTFLAFEVLLWQSADISVSIVSEAEKDGNNEVTISVLNTAGSTLLFYESAQMSGKIEYLSDEGWVEYCDISYTADNAEAISQQYGGTFAELEPGENWNVSVPDEVIAGMKNGTYRIKMTYITEKKYNDYLDKAFKDRVEESEESVDVSEAPEAPEAPESEEGFTETKEFLNGNGEDEPDEEKFLAESISEVFIKTFEFTAPEDFVSAISFDNSDIESDEPVEPRVRIIPDYEVTASER